MSDTKTIDPQKKKMLHLDLHLYIKGQRIKGRISALNLVYGLSFHLNFLLVIFFTSKKNSTSESCAFSITIRL